jgi:hypothetical protein
MRQKIELLQGVKRWPHKARRPAERLSAAREATVKGAQDGLRRRVASAVATFSVPVQVVPIARWMPGGT